MVQWEMFVFSNLIPVKEFLDPYVSIKIFPS